LTTFESTPMPEMPKNIARQRLDRPCLAMTNHQL
jgi:hypothetical protein